MHILQKLTQLLQGRGRLEHNVITPSIVCFGVLFKSLPLCIIYEFQ